ncbi:MAG: hypothetical protein H0T59_09230 [Chloroflexi bacterium]|nr:hypothetical protein [Chloroflexota bacterium]
MTTDRVPLPTLAVPSLLLLDDARAFAGKREREGESLEAVDPVALLLTCANCGAAMDERKCKLICRCGYFLSCSDYY